MPTAMLYMSFPGNAREALSFYQSVFGGELNLITFGEQVASGVEFPFEAPAEAIVHGTLVGPIVSLSGGDDLSPHPAPFARGSLSMVLELDTVEEVQRLIPELTADGGRVTVPFEQAPWGDYYGQVEDRFTMLWQLAAPTNNG